MVVQRKNKNKNKTWTYVAMTAGIMWYTFRYNYLVYRHATGITTATTLPSKSSLALKISLG